MANPPAPNGTTWRVDSQLPGFGPDGKGGFTDGYTISFTTGLGNVGAVFIPRKQYDPEAAIGIIRAHAQELDQVSQSGS